MSQHVELPYVGVAHHPCAERCQHADAVGAPEWASCGDVAYCDHYVERSMAVSEEMVFETCWLHGPTLWGLNFDTYRWSCPLDGCDTYLNEESRVKRGLPTILVPPLFGFTRRLP